MRILHLSDLHIKRVAGRLDDYERCIGHLCECVEKIQNNRAIDFIFITGDLVDKGGMSFDSLKDGFEAFDELVVKPLLKITNLPRTKVIIVPGNHDVEGKLVSSKFDDEHPMKSESDINWIFDKIMEGDEDGKNAIRRLETYNSYVERFAPGNLSDSDKYLTHLAKHFIFEADKRKIGISCLCSPWRCNERGETDNLVLGTRQLNEADTLMNGVDCRIGLIHHDPTSIDDWEKTMVKGLLQQKYDIIFLGHTHLTDDVALDNEKGRTAYCCASGIITGNVGDSTYKNGFEVVDVDIDMRCLEISRYSHNDDETFSQDIKFGKNGVLKLPFGTRRKIYPLKEIINRSHEHRYSLIPSERFLQLKDEILNTENQTLLIIAFSGLGKTRMVFEAALELDRNPSLKGEIDKYFYCEQSFESDELQNEIDEFVEIHREGNAVLILDNIDYRFFNLITGRYRRKKNIRFIGLTNKMFDIPEGIDNYQTITPRDTKPSVDEYIETKTANRQDNYTAKEDIKQFAHGFPMLAVALVDKYNNGENINIHDADDLINICWNNQGSQDPQETQLLKLISLFQPFPGDDENFNIILGSKCFTSLSTLDSIDKYRLLRRVKQKYDGIILEVTDNGDITVRPYPLAMFLAKQWLNEYGDVHILRGLGEYIKGLDASKSSFIIECMSRRLNKLDDDPTAVSLVGALMRDGGFFGCENVVCSELGSRLILAMSTVNPLAVSDALYKIFSGKSSDEIKDSLTSRARNNLVWALRYIIFNGPSYEKGIEMMGKFGLAETESYGNNSINTFTDSFHILLPGTETNLAERLRIINKFASSEKEIHQLVPFAIKGALSYGQFMRTGGNNFGSGRKADYMPSNTEVADYWKGVVDISVNLIEKGEFIEEFASIIKNNLFVWSARGGISFIIPLLKSFGPKYGFQLELSKRDWLMFIDNIKRRANESEGVLNEAIQLQPYYIKEDFCSELDEVAYRFHDEIKFSSENHWENVKAYFVPIARKFIDCKIYDDKEVLKELLIDRKMNTNYLTAALTSIIEDSDLSAIYDSIFSFCQSECNLKDSPFLSYLISATKDKEPTNDFLERIYNSGLHELYVASMARSETDNISRLPILSHRYAAKDFLDEYLKHVNVYLNEDFLTKLFDFLKEHFEEKPDAIISFLLRNRLWFNHLTPQHLDIVSTLITEVDTKQLTPADNREYWEVAAELIKRNHDDRLAAILNIKALQDISGLGSDTEVGDFYEAAFKNYLDVIWEDFAKTLFGERNWLYWHMSHAVRGNSLNSAHLFSIPETYLKEALSKYPERAPYIIANMCPLYKITEAGPKFAKWPQYLIDNFGEREDVLDSLASNMGTFSCVGSVIPIYRRQIDVLTPYKEHQIEKVREWATSNIAGLEESISREKAKEDFERLHYEN